MSEGLYNSTPAPEAENTPPHRSKKVNAAEAQKKQQKFLIFLIIFVVAGAIFIFYRSGMVGGDSSRRPVEEYLNAIAAKDFESYIKVMPPRIASGYERDLSQSGLSAEDFMGQLYSDYFEEFGDDMTVTLEFNGRSRVESKYLDAFKESYSSIYGQDISISSAFEIDVSALFSGSKSRDLIQLECFVIKSGRHWYIAGCDYKTVEPGE